MSEAGPTFSTHILDTQLGAPAAGVHVRLEHVLADGARIPAGEGVTDASGRIRSLVDGPLVAGAYLLTFDLHDAGGGFFRTVSLEIHVDDPGRSYHVPLLVAPFSITSYRGS